MPASLTLLGINRRIRIVEGAMKDILRRSARIILPEFVELKGDQLLAS